VLDLTVDRPSKFNQQYVMFTVSGNACIKHKNTNIFPAVFKDPAYTFEIHSGLRTRLYISIPCCKFTPEIKSVSGMEFNLIL